MVWFAIWTYYCVDKEADILLYITFQKYFSNFLLIIHLFFIWT